MTPSGVLANLLSFNISNGDLPLAGLALGSDSTFYGTHLPGRSSGSRHGLPDHHQRRADDAAFVQQWPGRRPCGGRAAAAAATGIFYGTTYKGGGSGYGTVFGIDTNGTLTTLASFDDTNGAFPLAGLVQDIGGAFYGTTTSGGASNNGAVFRHVPGGRAD